VFYHFDRYYLCCIFSDSAFWLHVCLIFFARHLYASITHPVGHCGIMFLISLLFCSCMAYAFMHTHYLGRGILQPTCHWLQVFISYYSISSLAQCFHGSCIVLKSPEKWKKNSNMQKSWNWLLILKSPDFWSVWSWKINLASMLVVMHLLISYKYFVK